MCSATQLGFRVIRLKDEVRGREARRSDTGPGKPYWKSPAGSTGFWTTGTTGALAGSGVGGVIGEDVAILDVVEGSVGGKGCGFDLDEPNMSAETLAPARAEAPATMAKVVLDIVVEDMLRVRQMWLQRSNNTQLLSVKQTKECAEQKRKERISGLGRECR